MNLLHERGVRVLSARANFAAIVIVVIAGLAVHFVIPGIVGDALGDAMFAVLILLGVTLVIPRFGLAWSAVTACGLCWMIELSQITGIPAALSRRWPIFRYILGTTFSIWDIIAYTVGIVAALAVIVKWHAKINRAQTDKQTAS